MDGMEPGGEDALERLCLLALLLIVSCRGLSWMISRRSDDVEGVPTRPRSTSLPLPFALPRSELTSPKFSSVIICSKAFSLLSNSSCSPSCRSASSSLFAISFSSDSDSDESGEVGRNPPDSLRWPWRVRMEEDDTLLRRAGEFVPKEFSRARTPRGAPSLLGEDMGDTPPRRVCLRKDTSLSGSRGVPSVIVVSM